MSSSWGASSSRVVFNATRKAVVFLLSQLSSSFFGLIVPAHNDDGKMTPFVSSTCFCCPRVPAEASSAREPAARRKIESFQRTSNDDDASPCRYLTTENCKSARALLSLVKGLFCAFTSNFLYNFVGRQKKREKRALPLPICCYWCGCAKKANEAR